jgi:hypothetical protein
VRRAAGGMAAFTAESVAASLFPPRAPLLLTQPGLIARYRLDAFLTAMVQAAQRDAAAAMFLLGPAQALWIPRTWIARSSKQP